MSGVKDSHFKLIASTHARTVEVGETVEYRLCALDPNGKGDLMWSPVTDTKNVSWVLMNNSQTGQPGEEGLVQMQLGSGTFKHKFTKPGKYVLVANIRVSDQGFGSFEAVEYPQSVQTAEAFLYDPWLRERTHSLDPAGVLSGLKRYYSVLEALGSDEYPNPAALEGQRAERYKQYKTGLDSYRKYIEALGKRLASTAPHPFGSEPRQSSFFDAVFDRPPDPPVLPGLEATDWLRRSILARHIVAETGEESELRVFLARYGIPIVGPLYPQASPAKAKWKLVDWTNPVDRGRTGEYDGEGDTDVEAVEACIKTWSQSNRYWNGRIEWEVPRGVCAALSVVGSFPTSGSTFWDDVSDFLQWVAIGAMIIAAVITLIAPVPGSQLASAALWIGVAGAIAGATSAAINIGQRHAEGFGNWKEDGVDALTIVGCLFGLGAIWARGATVLMPYQGAVTKFLFVGSVAVNGAQGVLITESSYYEVSGYIGDPNMEPDEKLRKILVVFGSVALQGALMYVDLKAGAKEMEHFNRRQPPGHGGEPPLSPAERLQRLADQNETIDATKKPKINAHTENGEHTTVVREEMERQPVHGAKTKFRPVTFEEKFPADEAFWRTRVIRDDEIILQHRFKPGSSAASDLIFHAHISPEGYVHVDIIQNANFKVKATGEIITDPQLGAKLLMEGKAESIKSSYFNGKPCLVPNELYPMMFDHFEMAAAKGGIQIKGADGQFAFLNYQKYKKAIAAGRDPVKAILEETATGPRWKQEFESRGYKYTMAEGYPQDEPEIESVFWKFVLSK